MMITKLFGVLCVVLFVVQAKKISPEEKDMAMALTEDCRKENKMPDEEMDALFEGKIPESKEAKCTMTCTMKQFKMVNEENGKLELAVTNLVKMAEANDLSKENVTMIEDKVTDDCEFGPEVLKCCMEEGKARDIDLDKMM